MLIRKVMKILFTLILVLGFFANNVVMSEVCFCGAGCPHNSQDKANSKLKTPFHNLCHSGLCKGCDIEKGNKIKAGDFSETTFQIKTINSISKIYTFYDCYYQNIVVKILDFIDPRTTAATSTIFLQNLSIRC